MAATTSILATILRERWSAIPELCALVPADRLYFEGVPSDAVLPYAVIEHGFAQACPLITGTHWIATYRLAIEAATPALLQDVKAALWRLGKWGDKQLGPLVLARLDANLQLSVVYLRSVFDLVLVTDLFPNRPFPE